LTTRDLPSAAEASLATSAGRPIAPEAAHLWHLDTERLRAASVADAWLACLEENERARYGDRGTSAAKRGYLGTRALARTALARYSGTPPHGLRFGTDRFGRPELTSPALPGLCFSLARTAGLAVGLFAFDREVGVDVERVAPIDAIALAARFFSPQEAAGLSALEGSAIPTRFYALWTLREAYLKARGVGLTLPLDQLVFHPTPSGGAAAEFGPAIGDDPAGWQFGLTWLTRRHLAATCIRRRSKGTATRICRFAAGGPV
jgi:4'-phosphopantetheinyl transferase